MSGAPVGRPRRPVVGPGAVAFRRGAGWLNLAATPTFLSMALLTSLHGGSPKVLCSTLHGASWLGGMSLMYALMGVFHSTPWMKLISKRWTP